LTLQAKSTTILLRIKVCCILDFDFLANLILDIIPVFALNLLEYLGIICPIDSLILLLFSDGYLSKVFKPVPIEILVKWDALAQLLQHLVSRGHAQLTLHVEGQRWLEALGWYNFDAPVLISLVDVVELLDVVDG
jgi:hypothetical protein